MNDINTEPEYLSKMENFVSCPFCASQIPALAKKCRHCRETLDHAMRTIDELKRNQQQFQRSIQPTVFMNAGIGSSSAAAGCGINGQMIGTKSRIVAALLAFFLGAFGIHKFYLGQTGWGVVYLLLCWTFIPTLISLIESVLYLLSTKRAFAIKYG